jgi:hypothetical protein
MKTPKPVPSTSDVKSNAEPVVTSVSWTAAAGREFRGDDRP